MPSKVFHVGETCLVMPRVVFDRTGGWAGGFWYAHEGIELAWRVWNTGHYVWYAGDMDVGHPVVDPRRHSEFYRLNARNRVWLARRNLPGVVRELYAWNWLLVDMMRLRNNKAARAQYIAGWRSGWNGTPWHSEARERLSWKTLLRMTIAGRLPII